MLSGLLQISYIFQGTSSIYFLQGTRESFNIEIVIIFFLDMTNFE